ncbi:MAG: hypothetical protein QHH05_02025, partial [Syntrophomonadaceae bacterium]|nr:hypothetical protein [Syntrophomonadaceae bacterium]
MSAPPTPTHSLLRLLAGAGTAAFVLGSAILAVWLLGASTAQIEGLTLRVWLAPAPAGSTVLELPPLGSLAADTHRAPFSLHVRLERIQPDAFAT